MSATYISRAWSCTVRLVVEDDRALNAAAEDLTALLGRVDEIASRFRPDSALSMANARAGRPTPVPKLLVELVGVALGAAVATDGAVDPTVGLAMQRIGYDRDIDAIEPDGPALAPRRSLRRWQHVRLNREGGLLTVPVGTAIDLGATCKAHIADRAAVQLSSRYRTGVLVELGGDLAVAGERPDGWCIRVAEREGEDGQLVLVRHGGLVTSTTTVRHWTRGGRGMHHIVDPRTGAPVDGPWRTASVAAPTALAANIASTAALVLGDDAVAWLEAHGRAARLVARDGSVHTTAGWPVTRELAAAS
jgi:thiamine biosynthesis lipoprotein